MSWVSVIQFLTWLGKAFVPMDLRNCHRQSTEVVTFGLGYGARNTATPWLEWIPANSVIWPERQRIKTGRANGSPHGA